MPHQVQSVLVHTMFGNLALPSRNRILETADRPILFATSTTTEPPACVPSLPSQCSVLEAIGVTFECFLSEAQSQPELNLSR
jgi:hypothetical protein